MSFSAGRVDRAVRRRKARLVRAALEYEEDAPNRWLWAELHHVAERLSCVRWVSIVYEAQSTAESPAGESTKWENSEGVEVVGVGVECRRFWGQVNGVQAYLVLLFFVGLVGLVIGGLVSAFVAVGVFSLVWVAFLVGWPSTVIQVTLRPGDEVVERLVQLDVDPYSGISFGERAWPVLFRANELTDRKGPSRFDVFVKKVRRDA